MIRVPLPTHTSSNASEVAVAVANQEFEVTGVFAEIHEQVAGRLGSPGSGGCAVTPRMCTVRVRTSHHEGDVQAFEEHRVSVQELARQDPGCLGGQELPPGR